MKRKITVMVLVVCAVMLMAGEPAGATNEDLNCLLGFMTTDIRGYAYCLHTLPPGNCVVCYTTIVVKAEN